MALQKEVSHDSGVTIEYWRIIELRQNYETNVSHIIVGGYLSENSRLDGNSKFATMEVDSYLLPLDDTLSEAYNFLKTLPFFKDALDN